MAKKYQEKVFFTIEELKRIHTLINMTAEELYIRYGKKRGELIFERQTIFEDTSNALSCWKRASKTVSLLWTLLIQTAFLYTGKLARHRLKDGTARQL